MKAVNLALSLILFVVLFTLITQRLMNTGNEVPKRFEKMTQLQQAKNSVQETGSKIWNTIHDMNIAPTWTVASDREENIVPAAQESSSSAWGANEKVDSLTDPEEPSLISVFDGLLPQFLPLLATSKAIEVSEDSKHADIRIQDVDHVTSSEVIKSVVNSIAVTESQVLDKKLEPSTTALAVASLVPQFLPLPVVTQQIVTGRKASKTLPSDPDLHLLHHEYEDHGHPRLSPRPGTHIGDDARLALLQCPKQAKCIVPQLQLKIKLKIYLCRHPTNSGIRFYFLTREGLKLHPNIEIITDVVDINQADFILYLPGSAPWHLTECTNMSYIHKLIVLDEFDGHTPFYPRQTALEMKRDYGKKMIWYFMYFKRSFVARKDGRFLRYPMLELPDVYPLTYSISDSYVQEKFNHVREVDILCTLRGSALMTTRQRVQDWIAEYATHRNISNVITSEVSSSLSNTCN